MSEERNHQPQNQEGAPQRAAFRSSPATTA